MLNELVACVACYMPHIRWSALAGNVLGFAQHDCIIWDVSEQPLAHLTAYATATQQALQSW